MVEASAEGSAYCLVQVWAKCWIQDEARNIQDVSEIFILRKKTHSDELTGGVGGGVG
jgi:hypothetical protein